VYVTIAGRTKQGKRAPLIKRHSLDGCAGLAVAPSKKMEIFTDGRDGLEFVAIIGDGNGAVFPNTTLRRFPLELSFSPRQNY